MQTQTHETARSRWRRAAEAAEAGADPAAGELAGRTDQPMAAPEAEAASSGTDQPTWTREKVKRLLGALDANARKSLDLEPRDDVDLELSDADSLDLAAELCTPFAQAHGDGLTPGVQAAGGLGLLILELLKDGGLEVLMEKAEPMMADGEPAATPEETPAKTEDF